MRLPGTSRPDFCDPVDERERWHLERKRLQVIPAENPRFPASFERLVEVWVFASALLSLVAVGFVIYAIIRFLPLLQRVSEIAGVSH